MTRLHVGALAILLAAAGALAGCVGDAEDSTNEDLGPGDETGDIADRDDTLDGDGEDGLTGNETGDGAASNDSGSGEG